VGSSRAPWQVRDLADGARALLDAVSAAATDEPPTRAVGRDERVAADVLERRLLVVATSQHTTRGHHETVLRSWSSWAEARGVATGAAPPVVDEADPRRGPWPARDPAPAG
jgi:hypothetical protein